MNIIKIPFAMRPETFLPQQLHMNKLFLNYSNFDIIGSELHFSVLMHWLSEVGIILNYSTQ